jgi:hypothetical protein
VRIAAAATDFLRFAGYTWAPANSNKCPATFFRIATEDACSVAAAANGKTYGGKFSNPTGAKGCFWYQGANEVFFNTDPVGSAGLGELPLCIGAPLRFGSACAAPAVEASMLNTRIKCGHNGSDATPPLVVQQTRMGHRPPTASMSGLMCSWHAHVCL